MLVNAKGKSDWIKDVLGKVRRHVNEGKYRITFHAQERQKKYKVTLSNVLFVLLNGFHEEEKTLFDTTFQTWKYAIRGKMIDGQEELRVIVAFENEMAVLTIIPLKEKK